MQDTDHPETSRVPEPPGERTNRGHADRRGQPLLISRISLLHSGEMDSESTLPRADEALLKESA